MIKDSPRTLRYCRILYNTVNNMANRAPKQWCLTKVETVNSYENWRQNLLYTLSLDTNFLPYLENGATWGKKTHANPHRKFVDDDDNVPEANCKTRAQKVSTLELMLGQIANYTPIISRSTIINNSTTLRNIWQIIRLHYGFQSTGAHLLGLYKHPTTAKRKT